MNGLSRTGTAGFGFDLVIFSVGEVVVRPELVMHHLHSNGEPSGGIDVIISVPAANTGSGRNAVSV